MAIPLEDLPQMWQKPSYADLVDILQSLELQPPVWNHRRRRDSAAAAAQEAAESLASQNKAQVTRYLSSIIKSPLAWIDSDDEKEQLWDQASKRMSERCGRAAMGDIVRRWPFDGGADEGDATAAIATYEPFELAIREPGMTGAALGLKTWGSAYVLARHLPLLGATSLFRLFDESMGQPPPRVLELGSGTGLLGVAAAALWKVDVALSDLPGIVPNLKHNAERNKEVVEGRGGRLSVGPLTWGGEIGEEVDEELFGEPFQFPIVLVADPLYFDDHPALLASAISQNLALGSESRAVVMVPKRDDTTRRLLAAFRQAMRDLDTPLICEEEDELPGQDDWVENETGGRINCWLGVFSRGGTTPRSAATTLDGDEEEEACNSE